MLPRVFRSRAEQSIQAAKFSVYGAIDHVVDAAATTPEARARLIERAIEAPARARLPVDLDGVRATCRAIMDEVARRRHPGSDPSELGAEPVRS